MYSYAEPLANLINRLSKLPGIGPKSAQRLAYHLLYMPNIEVEKLAESLIEMKKSVHQCEVCFNLTENSPCSICMDETRNHQLICVVEEAKDIISMERLRAFHGVYHVLHGAISPLRQIGPEELRIAELLERLKKEAIEEVIIATNANLEGETTAMYLGQLISPLGTRVTRLAQGLPMGGEIEYADELTLSYAFAGRKELQ